MMNIDNVLENRRLTSALVGLTPQEFVKLLPDFEQVLMDERWKTYEKNKKHRERKPGGGPRGFLKEVRDKLFFILFYYKCYPTYDVLTFLYGFNRSNAFRRQEQTEMVTKKVKLGHILTLKEKNGK